MKDLDIFDGLNLLQVTIYDIWNKLFILQKKTFFSSSIFTFSKTVIFGYFWFLAKNIPKLQKLFKKRPKSSICLIIFQISSKKIHFLTLTFFLGPLTWNRPNALLILSDPIWNKSTTLQNPPIYNSPLLYCRNFCQIK